MRCIICYQRGPFLGYIDFGVTSKDDPVIAEKIKELGSKTTILEVKFW